MALRIGEAGESERRPVIGRIGAAKARKYPGPKGRRLPGGLY